MGLANPAQVNETPTHISLEADDTDFPGRGLHESNTDPDPFGSLIFRGVEAPDDHSTRNLSEKETSETSESSDSSLDDDKDPPESIDFTLQKPNPNKLKKRPGLKIASLNMRGCQKDRKNKMKMVIDWMHMKKILILALQEMHTLNEDIDDLNMKFKQIKIYGSGLSTASRGILFLVSKNIGTPIQTEFKNIINGRIGALKIDYGDQKLNVINIYMPNNKVQQKEMLTNLRRTMRADKDIKNSELIVLGDWNFVEDQVDRNPQHTDKRGVTKEMTKLKASFKLTDGWQKANPDTRSFTWEGVSGNDKKHIFLRIDRIYVSNTVTNSSLSTPQSLSTGLQILCT